MIAPEEQYQPMLEQDNKPAKATTLEAGDRMAVFTDGGTVGFFKGADAAGEESSGNIFFQEMGEGGGKKDKLYLTCLTSASFSDACNLAKLVATAAGLGYQLVREGNSSYLFLFIELSH